jgi:thiamine biosynthesis lipoprotein
MCNAWRPIRPFILLALFALLSAPAPAGHAAQPAVLLPQEYTQVHMGMPVRLRMYAGNGDAARTAAAAAFARVAALDAMMSDYRPESELRHLSDAGTAWSVVSDELYTVLERAVEISRATGGAFDPTVGPLVLLWREARRTGRMPDAPAIAQAKAAVGWRHLELDRRRHAVRLARAGMRLDLGGIAKGYILQEALGTLRASGVRCALVEAGGDIVVGDAPPGRDGWRIDVAGADEAFTRSAARLTNAALATSGPTAQFVEIGGVRYSHVVDPQTGLGLTNRVTAHVIAPDGITADALATALTAAPAGSVPRIIARFRGVRAAVVRGE